MKTNAYGLWHRMLFWFRSAFSQPQHVALPPPVEETAAPPPRRRNRPPAATEFEFTGSHYYFDTLLKDLDDYFKALSAMKKCAPDMYSYFKRVGAQVLPSRKPFFCYKEIPAAWHDPKKRQAQGMWHANYPTVEGDEAKWVAAKFIHFQRIKSASHVERAKNDIYAVSILWPFKDYYFGGTYHVTIKQGGEIALLKENHSKAYTPERKRRLLLRKRAHAAPDTFQRMEWAYPKFLVDHVQKMHADPQFYQEEAGMTVEDVAARLFIQAVTGCYDAASDGLQVRCAKGNLTARFNISMLRTPYFFRDRQKTVTESGKTKPIFHIVRAHRRIVESGREVFVKTHFRGVRSFSWNDYSVLVSMPGLHHAALEDFTVAAREPDDQTKTKKWLTPGELGERMAAELDKGQPGWREPDPRQKAVT